MIQKIQNETLKVMKPARLEPHILDKQDKFSRTVRETFTQWGRISFRNIRIWIDRCLKHQLTGAGHPLAPRRAAGLGVLWLNEFEIWHLVSLTRNRDLSAWTKSRHIGDEPLLVIMLLTSPVTILINCTDTSLLWPSEWDVCNDSD